jgi:hypothetical protein
MQVFRSWRRRWTGIALCGMLGLALAPTVSRALTADGPHNPFTEICSAAGGLQSLPAGAVGSPLDLITNAQGDPLGGATDHSLDHCPLCALAAAHAVLPGADPAAAPLLDGADFVAALFDHAPRPLFAWAAAQARAPPSPV